VCVVIFRPNPTPVRVAGNYVKAVSAGRCKRAYKQVSGFLRYSNTDFADYASFKKSVCDVANEKYTYIGIHRCGKPSVAMGYASLDCQIEFRTSWTPVMQTMPFSFNLRRELGRWRLDSPAGL
jgi:hypothetical protein